MTANSAVLNAYISQGSVVTCLRCGGIFNDDSIVRECARETASEIGQHLMKILRNMASFFITVCSRTHWSLVMHGKPQCKVCVLFTMK